MALGIDSQVRETLDLCHHSRDLIATIAEAKVSAIFAGDDPAPPQDPDAQAPVGTIAEIGIAGAVPINLHPDFSAASMEWAGDHVVLSAADWII